ncbi:MAG: hydrogenase maturation protease [Anaerolineae bacterium]|nr:hydrogenase maturation protease [Anaerolineae bacterium]
MSKLIIGYGNPYRQDDGVAWHILQELSGRLDIPAAAPFEQGFLPASQPVDLWSVLQIVPEMAEQIAQYERVCFVDAHTGIVPEDVSVSEVIAEYSSSPLTHHLTPSALLSITNALYSVNPRALLVSIRGYEFGFIESLSERTKKLVPLATDRIMSFINSNSDA